MKTTSSPFPRLALCGALLVGVGSANAQGIPVFDYASLIQAIQSVMQSVQQIENQIRQIEQLQSQVQAISGYRNLGSILNNPALQNYIPADATRIVGTIQSGGYAGLGGSAKALRDAQMTYNCLDLDGAARTQCQSSLAMPYQHKAFMQDGMDASRARMAQIQALMGQIDATTDQKAVSEIQARIEAENAMIQQQQAQVAMARGLADAEHRIAESRAKEAQLQQASRTGRMADFVR